MKSNPIPTPIRFLSAGEHPKDGHPYSLIPNTRVYILLIAIAFAFFACGKITEGDEDGISGNGNNYGNGNSSSSYDPYNNDPIQNSDPPAGVIVAVNSTSNITIGWGVVSGATGYYIYRSESTTGTYIQVGTSATTSYEDNGLSAGTTYYYRIAAYNTYGTGSQSSLVSATTLPNAPNGVTATVNSTNSIIVAWETVFGATGYYIYRSESAYGDYTQVGSSATNSYTNTGLSAGVVFYYKVAAYNSSGIGAQSSYASAEIQPGVTTGVTAMTNSISSIRVSWTAVSGATGYYIYFSTSADGTYTKVDSSTANSYINTGLSMGTTYYYKVAAYNGGGMGSQSSYVYATTSIYGSINYGDQTYKTVVIGTQNWMAENLNYNPSDGMGSNLGVCYNNIDANCTKYGRLYSWYEAMTVCHNGWHIPSDDEWTALINYVGGFSTAGLHLKATSGWNDYNGASGNGLDTYGFAALPGNYSYVSNLDDDVGNYGKWWSSTSDDDVAYMLNMNYDSDYVYESYVYGKNSLLSVRCVMD